MWEFARGYKLFGLFLKMKFNEIYKCHYGRTSSEYKLAIKEFDEEDSYFKIPL